MGLLHFWLSCVIKAFWDSAFFTGTNKTGFVYAALVAAFSLAGAAWRRAMVLGGWKMMWHWKEIRAIFGFGALIAVAAWVVIFLGHLISAPHGLWTEAEGRTEQALRKASGERKSLNG